MAKARGNVVKLTSLQALGPELKAGGQTLREADEIALPELSEMPILNAEKIERQASGIEEWSKKYVGTLQEKGADIARAIAVVAKLDRQNPDLKPVIADWEKRIRASEEAISRFLKEVGGNANSRERFVRAYIQEGIIQNLSYRTPRELNYLADTGLALGYFSVAKDDAPELQCVTLPVSGSDQRWQAQRLSTNFPGSKGVIPLLRKKVEEMNARRAQETAAAREKLSEGADRSFLEAIENGSGGETVLVVPTERKGEKTFHGGNLRLKVQSGKIFAVDAVGHGAFVVAVRKIRDAGLFLPTTVVTKPRLEVKGKVEDYNLLYLFHKLVHRGYEVLVAKAPEQESAPAPESPVETEGNA